LEAAKVNKNDLKFFAIWFPWEFIAGIALAIKGWPTRNYFFWPVAGFVLNCIWKWRKGWML
jgi:hypothetical protein